MATDPRLVKPEDRYEGPLLRFLGRIVGISTFAVFFGVIVFPLLKLILR